MMTGELMVSDRQRQQLELFHLCLFTEVLLVGNQSGVFFDMEMTEADYVIVPMETGRTDPPPHPR